MTATDSLTGRPLGGLVVDPGECEPETQVVHAVRGQRDPAVVAVVLHMPGFGKSSKKARTYVEEVPGTT